MAGLEAEKNGHLRKKMRKCLFCNGDPNGTRTRVIGVRGRRPRPLDDGTDRWLGNQDSNLNNQLQRLAYCRCTIPHLLVNYC